MDYSYQLYSSRNFQPWQDVLSRLQAAGYTQVEGISALYEDADETAALLTQYNLTMPSGHFSLDSLEQQPDAMLTIAKTLGMKAVYCPHLPPEQRPLDAAGYHALGQRLENAGKPFVDAGLRFGWHNHDFEFLALEDGSIPMVSLFDGGPALEWEADLAWVARAGADPIEWIDRYADRISAVHVKDIAATGECLDEDGWADVGHGSLDWAAYMALTKKTPASLFVMEHDNPSDDNRFAQRSIEYLRQLQ